MITRLLVTLVPLLALDSLAYAKPTLSTRTTGLYPSKTCKTKIAGGEGQDPVLTCPAGAKGFAVEVSFSAVDTHVTVTGPSSSTTFSGRLGDKLEWRLANGQPYALVLEMADTDLDADGSPAVNPRVAVFAVGDSTAKGQFAIASVVKAKLAKEKQRAWTEARALAQTLASK